ncbi:MAG: non-canonical purine NTP pyrophosphatase, RdgB/HAM1 family [Bacillota bacterium]|nr:MAG: non-canonical purine NTP pyrophosphatase, RdgB/HAM1 family [Bacillota bacterium]
MAKRLIVATLNAGKAREFKAMLPMFEVRCFKDLGVDCDVEETGKTFYENALLKARAAAKLFFNDYVLADDSGLEVDALGGAPGVYTARYAGEGASDGENIAKLLSALNGCADRTARFVCQLVLLAPDGEIIAVRGESEGEILREIRGAGGFGYDPVFFSRDLQKGFGECTDEEKNSVSHRGRALKKLLDKLQ